MLTTERTTPLSRYFGWSIPTVNTVSSTQCLLSYRIDLHIAVKERDRQIASGEVDIGRPIVPVSSVLHRNGTTVKQIVFGRAISLQSIRRKHLQAMADKRLLRHTDTSGFTVDDCRKILEQYSSKFGNIS